MHTILQYPEAMKAYVDQCKINEANRYSWNKRHEIIWKLLKQLEEHYESK